MKNLLLLLGLLCNITQLSAQDFAPIGATWHYTELYAFAGNVSYLKIESVKDTVIQGKTCRKFKKYSSLACAFNFDFAYSEDSVVYFYSPAIDSFQILYDIKAEKDSSWIIIFEAVEAGELDTMLIMVDSVSSVTINAVNLKKLHVTYHSLNFGRLDQKYSSEIIERIGDVQYLSHLYSLLGLVACDMNYSAGLRCYQDSVLGFYETGLADSCDHTAVGIKELSPKTEFSIFPNPAQNFIEVKSELQDEMTIEITNLLGQLRQSKTFISRTDIDVSDLAQGVYLVSFKQEGRLLGSKKFVKR